MKTRTELLAEAAERGHEVSTLRHLSHPELELDANGGHAFEDAEGHIVVLGYGGSFGSHLLYEGCPTAEDVIQRWLARQRHDNREIEPQLLGIWQQAAVAAVRDGTVSVLGLGAEDADYAEFIRIRLARSPGDPLRALAAQDHLLSEPEPGRRYTHPCPVCTAPAQHTDRYPRMVCDACYVRTKDSKGRLVSGANTQSDGGFVAHFAGTGKICTEVTTSNRCWIDGRDCVIEEGHTGGVVVQTIERRGSAPF